jgi:hypothetical protein
MATPQKLNSNSPGLQIKVLLPVAAAAGPQLPAEHCDRHELACYAMNPALQTALQVLPDIRLLQLHSALSGRPAVLGVPEQSREVDSQVELTALRTSVRTGLLMSIVPFTRVQPAVTAPVVVL